MILSYIVLIAAAFAAGIVNSIAGGGSFMTFPALMLTGLDPRAANITSTIALYPMQVSTGFSGRKTATGTPHLSFKALLVISLIGGIIGAVLLLLTPPTYFAKLVPWLVLFATSMFAWGSFRKQPALIMNADKASSDRLGKTGAVLAQLGISIYGGYFGGGIGLLMLAALTLAGMKIRQAATTKNILAAIINTSAVAVFFLSKDIYWIRAGIVAVAATAGGLVGVRLLDNINERYLRMVVVAVGAILSVVLFLRAH
jgi:uncharacterized membrane protein YfcA